MRVIKNLDKLFLIFDIGCQKLAKASGHGFFLVLPRRHFIYLADLGVVEALRSASMSF